MATTFKYASQSDLKNYFNNFGDYDQKVQIYPTLTSGNLHLFRDCGYVDTLFINGEEIYIENYYNIIMNNKENNNWLKKFLK